MINWIKGSPGIAGRYLVSNGDEVNIARYLPKKNIWKFPSAQQSFLPTHWQEIPSPPKG